LSTAAPDCTVPPETRAAALDCWSDSAATRRPRWNEPVFRRQGLPADACALASPLRLERIMQADKGAAVWQRRPDRVE
jgi:hypothetical protein